MNALDIFVVGFVLIALPSIVTIWGFRVAKRLLERRNKPQATPITASTNQEYVWTAHELGVRFPKGDDFSAYDAPAFARVAVE